MVNKHKKRHSASYVIRIANKRKMRLLLDTYQNTKIQKTENKHQRTETMYSNRNPVAFSMLVGMENGMSTLENRQFLKILNLFFFFFFF